MPHPRKQPVVAHTQLPAAWRTRVAVYGFAIAATGLTLGLRLNLSPWLGDRPLLVSFFATHEIPTCH